MLTHEQLYKKIGLHKLDHFIEPRLLNDTEFVFPIRSELNWFKISAVVDTPTLNIGYLTSIKKRDKPVVVSRYAYSEPIGYFKTNENNVLEVIRKQQKENPDMIFIKPKQKMIKVPKENLIIDNYGTMSAVHIYQQNELSTYNRWRNALNSLVNNLNNIDVENNRHFYLMLELPSNIPNKDIFDKTFNQNTHQILENFPTSKHLTLLELWKFLTPKYIKDSLFYKIKRSNLQNITILFVYNNKVTLCNLNTLVSAVREYEGKTSIQQQPANVIRKMFLVYLMKIKTEVSKSHAELNNNETPLDLNGVTNIDNSSLDKHDVDNILENEYDEAMMDVNYDEISDTILNTNKANEIVDNTITDIDNLVLDGKSKLFKKIEALKVNNVISKKDMDEYNNILIKQDNLLDPYKESKETLKEILTYDKTDFNIPEDLKTIPDINIIQDKNQLEDTIKTIDKYYIKNIYKKDMLNVLYSLQNRGLIIKDHEVVKSEDILGGVEIHTLELKPLTGKPSKISFRIPLFKEDGTFKISGHNYKLRKQRQQLNIWKIDSDTVALNTYYGKSFITRSDFKKDQIGYWFRRKLIETTETNPLLTNLVFMPVKLVDVKTPKLYSDIAQYTKMFKLGNTKFSFDYNNRNELLPNIDLKEIEGTKYILIGYINNKTPMLMGYDNELYKYENKKYTKIDNIFKQLNIDENNAPIESISIKIFKKKIPVAVLLAYYLGLTNLLKYLKADYKILNRTERYTLKENEFILTFKDKKLVLNKNNQIATLILAGFNSISNEIKNVEYDLLNKRISFPVLFNFMDLPTLYINEINIMEDMFVDPISKTVLELNNEPTTLVGLLIKSAELLNDNNYINPNDTEGILVKGHERIAGMVYSELVNSIRDFENKNNFSKSKVILDPFSVWKVINSDSTVMLSDDLNPIAALKQLEDLTYIGSQGISKDAISQDKRVYHKSEVGLVSEAVKDSGDVGVSAYLSANPKILNVRGIVDKDKKNLNPSNLFSTSALLSPNCDKDDGKRMNFIQIQNGHVIPINNMRVPAVRTGYEAILPYRMDESYCYMAEDDGEVEMVNPDSYIKIIFKSGIKKTVKLGTWNTKEESNVSYKHTLITNLKKGSKFKKGHAISYDEAFFEPDIFDKNRVIFKTGTYLRVALMESTNTYEDSTTVSYKASKKLGATIVKSKSFVLNIDDNIVNMVKIGTNVEPNDLLFSIAGSNMINSDGKFDSESLAVLQNIKNKSPKAKMRGKIQNIRVYYNCELGDMSETLRTLAIESNKRLSNFTGKVNSSYSIKGKPLLPNTVEVKVYIEDNVKANMGDKLVASLQLKCTISDVFKFDMITEDGKDVDMTFSTKSIANRIVSSPTLNATATTVLNVLRDRVVDMYFK